MCCPTHSHSPHSPVDTSSVSFSLSQEMVVTLGKISAVALGVLACMADSTLFYSYFAVGALWGIYDRFQKPEHSISSSQIEQISSPGYIEQLTGSHLPPLFCLGINVSAIACHIDHHPGVFIPATGLALGVWTGHKIVDLGQFAFTQCS